MPETHTPPATRGEHPDPRTRIIAAATELLAHHGPEGVTTRAVAAAAGVQAPAIYRLFGDKGGLLDAVAEHGLTVYLSDRRTQHPDPDPVEDLRLGWDTHIEFGLAHPALYSLMYGHPRPGVHSPAEEAAEAHLARRVHRLAASGHLRVNERLATDLVRASGRGTVLTLLAMPEEERDQGLAESAREAMINAITTEAPAWEDPSPASAATALRATLPEATALTPNERGLLAEWLDRLTS
ncbi:TetR/AcrR family transcriptional regulator [Streptomyces sp. NPDC005438]|uniref:TetR/AcrR family transcriptional regulator n=1 Tax=Streptomyces sp. NPDC005438 TaxID=3156880 RepID=UPI0033A3DD0F